MSRCEKLRRRKYGLIWTLKSVSSTLISTSDAYFRSKVVSGGFLLRFQEIQHTRTDGQYMLTMTDLSVCEHEKRGVIMVV